jgi:hypothetical protein
MVALGGVPARASRLGCLCERSECNTGITSPRTQSPRSGRQNHCALTRRGHLFSFDPGLASPISRDLPLATICNCYAVGSTEQPSGSVDAVARIHTPHSVPNSWVLHPCGLVFRPAIYWIGLRRTSSIRLTRNAQSVFCCSQILLISAGVGG